MINKNTDYKLGSTEVLIIEYTDTNDLQKVVKYSEGDIIKPNFDLKSTSKYIEEGNTPLIKELDEAVIEEFGLRPYLSTDPRYSGKLLMFSIKPKEEIEKRKLNVTILDKKTPCYWIMNDSKNRLFTQEDLDADTDTYTKMLSDNEYFFYTDDGFNDLVTLGSGTILKCAHIIDNWELDLVNANEIIDKGLLALKSKWKRLNFSENDTMTLNETSILTLTEGDKVLTTELNDLTVDSNTLKMLNGNLRYTIGEETKWLGNIHLTSDNSWGIKTRLDINSGKDISQTLLENQVVEFTNADGQTATVNPGSSFNLSRICQVPGGDSVNVQPYSTDSQHKIKDEDYYSLYYYNQSNSGIDRNEYGFGVFRYNSSLQKDCTFIMPSLDNFSLLTIYWKKSEASTGNLSITTIPPAKAVAFFNDTDDTFKDSLELREGINVIKINKNTKYLKLEGSTTSITGDLLISKLNFYTGLNPMLGIDTFVTNTEGITSDKFISDLMKTLRLKGSIGNINKFYYNNEIDNSKIIESNDLTSPYALYDYNNVANKFTLSEIDIVNSAIDIVRSSRI